MMQFGNVTLKRCKYGWMLFKGGPYIGKSFELYGQYSESEVSMMRNFLRAGDTVIDVGANVGDLTIPLSQIVGDAGRVYAVESQPENFNILCANLALNGIQNTKPINSFIADSDQVNTGSAVWGQYAYVGATWPPTFQALDALELEACNLIKVDVDGKELEVLRSGEMQIERFRPVLYFENDVREASVALLSFVMEKLGYDLYWHLAPIYEESNFFGNPVNHWAPKNICSLMVLGLPSEHKISVPVLKRIVDSNEWWNLAP